MSEAEAPPDVSVGYETTGAKLHRASDRHWKLLGAAICSLLAAVMFAPLGVWPLAVLGFIGFGVSLAAMVGAITKEFLSPDFVAGTVRVGKDGVSLDGKREPASERLDNASLTKAPDGAVDLRLGRKGEMFPRLVLRASDAEATKLIAGLGLDPAHASYTHTALTPFVFSPAVFLGSVVFSVLGAALGVPMTIALLMRFMRPELAAVLAMPMLVPYMGLMFSRTRTVIGADGVLVKWLAFERFCAFRDVVSVERGSNSVVLHKRDGTTFPIRVAQSRAGTVDITAREIDALIERIERARALGGAGPSALDPALFTRNDRAVGEWLSSVRELLSKPDSFRRAAVTREDVWRVLEDNGADPSARAGAAAALAPELDEQGRTRVRVVLDTVVDGELRAVLDAASEADEAKLSKTLGAMPTPRRG